MARGSATVEEELGRLLRGLLEAVASGELEPLTPRALGLVREMEGATIALEALRGEILVGE